MEASAGGWARRALPGFFSSLRWWRTCPPRWPGGRAGRGRRARGGHGGGRGAGLRGWGCPAASGRGGPAGQLAAGLGGAAAPDRQESTWLTVAAAGPLLAGAVDEVAPGAGPAGLKRPNDLEGGRKAAGLLAEAHLEGDRLAAVLLGMGSTRRPGRRHFPPEVAGRATSVSLAAGAPVDRGDPLAAWAWRSLVATPSCAPAGRVRCWPPTGSAWSPSAARSGPTVGAASVEGTAVDLTLAGALVVQTATGARVEVTAGDVHHLRHSGCGVSSGRPIPGVDRADDGAVLGRDLRAAPPSRHVRPAG